MLAHQKIKIKEKGENLKYSKRGDADAVDEV